MLVPDFTGRITETAAASSHKGEVQGALTSGLVRESVSTQWKEQFLILGVRVESRWRQPVVNPLGKPVRLERRQLGIVSKILCTGFCGILCPVGDRAGRPAAPMGCHS